MSPRLKVLAGSESAAAKKPRTLKLPVGCRHSSLSRAPSTGISGVLWTWLRARSAAERMRARSITWIINPRDADLRLSVCGLRQAFDVAAHQLLVAGPCLSPLWQVRAAPPGLDVR